MSCLQADSTTVEATRAAAKPLRRDFINSLCPDAFEKSRGRTRIELWIDGLNDEEELVRTCQREPRSIEYRVIGLRQPVERDHADRGRKRREQDREFVRRNHERRPACERPSSDVHRVLDRRR